MTQHPSLKIKGAGAEHRSVLKRFERLLKLQKEEKWKEGQPIFGLPKVKTTRLKIKKEKAAPPPEAAVAEGAAPAEAQKEAPAAEKSPQAKSGKPVLKDGKPALKDSKPEKSKEEKKK